MPAKRKNSGKDAPFIVSYPTGSWHIEVYHGWDIWIPSDNDWERYSPRQVAIAHALREFWRYNRGLMFPWRDSIAETRRSFIRDYAKGSARGVPLTISRTDYTRAKEIIREVLFEWPDPKTGQVYVYASTRGGKAISGFIDQQDEAEVYEATNHRMLRKFEARIANGTVITAASEFGVPVKQKKMPTKTLT